MLPSEYESEVWWRGGEWSGDVLRVVLYRHVVRVAGQLHDLHPLVVGVPADELHPGRLELRDILRVHLVPAHNTVNIRYII